MGQNNSKKYVYVKANLNLKASTFCVHSVTWHFTQHRAALHVVLWILLIKQAE